MLSRTSKTDRLTPRDSSNTVSRGHDELSQPRQAPLTSPTAADYHGTTDPSNTSIEVVHLSSDKGQTSERPPGQSDINPTSFNLIGANQTSPPFSASPIQAQNISC